MVCRFHVGYSYIPQDARHDFGLVRVLLEANAFKKGDEDVQGALQPDRVWLSDQPVVNKKGHYLFARH
jgi:hypothetical protein